MLLVCAQFIGSFIQYIVVQKKIDFININQNVITFSACEYQTKPITGDYNIMKIWARPHSNLSKTPYGIVVFR